MPVLKLGDGGKRHHAQLSRPYNLIGFIKNVEKRFISCVPLFLFVLSCVSTAPHLEAVLPKLCFMDC